MRIVPRSLIGQVAALVAIALFVAQAINFTLLLSGRRSLRFEQATGPAVTRLADAAERVTANRALPDRPRRGPARVDLLARNPIPGGLTREPEVETAIRNELAERGVTATQVVTGVRPITADDPRLRRMPPRRAERAARAAAELMIAAELPGKGWLVVSSPWPRDGIVLIWRLLGQTLILYAVVLLPVLWIGRRIARPLHALTGAAREFGRGGDGEPLMESGPADVRALIAAFKALRLRVGAMLDEKDRMLGAIGHDLRTPLAALRVRIESVEDDSDRTKMAETIDEMSRTLDDILSLARLGRPSEPATEVDLAALVDAVVEDFRDLGAAVEMADTPRVQLRLRPALMRRAVRNLIENAVKYGGGAEVSLIAEPAEARICVADRGPGIPVDRLDEAFDPFTRLETSRNRDTGGIGLGLALARAIVRDAGGEIRLSARDGGGLLAEIVSAARLTPEVGTPARPLQRLSFLTNFPADGRLREGRCPKRARSRVMVSVRRTSHAIYDPSAVAFREDEAKGAVDGHTSRRRHDVTRDSMMAG